MNKRGRYGVVDKKTKDLLFRSSSIWPCKSYLWRMCGEETVGKVESDTMTIVVRENRKWIPVK